MRYFCVFRRDFRPTSLERSQEKIRLRFYKIYAFGIPLLISSVAATLNHMRKDSLKQDAYLQPRFCESEYWFAGQLHFVTNKHFFLMKFLHHMLAKSIS